MIITSSPAARLPENAVAFKVDKQLKSLKRLLLL